MTPLQPAGPRLSRRGFMAASAGAATVMFSACSSLPVIPGRPLPSANDAAGWVRHEAGRFTLFVPCAEMGQHIGSALRTVAAVELGVAEAQIELLLPASTDIAPVRATVGSDSVHLFAPPLAQACAQLRAAIQDQTPVAATAQRPGVATPDTPAMRAAWDRGPSPLPPAALRDLVTGRPLFAADRHWPGMLHGRVLRAPSSPELESAPLQWDADAARSVPGFVALVLDERLRHAGSQGLGIVARTPGALDRIAQALAPRWRVEGAFTPQDVAAQLDIDNHLKRGALRHRLRSDDVGAEGPWTIDLRVDIPFAAHASIEARSAVAHFVTDAQGSRLQVWAGTQDLFYVRDTLARRLSLSAAQVQVQACRIGGGFGGRTLVLVELEAALLSQAAGAAVKVQWTRAQELAGGFHRPPSSHRIRARLHDGRINAWWHAFTSSHILFTPAAMPVWMQRAADFLGDQGVARGARLHYAVPRQRIEFDALRLPVHGGPWRGLGAGPNGLAIESAVDACAHAAGRDALEFRLEHTADARLHGVLRAVAALSGWQVQPARRGADLAAASGRGSVWRGMGLACGVYKEATRAAVVAAVEVERASGQVRVTAMWCAHDCGQVISPDGVRAQVEGNLAWSLGMVLVESLPLGDSGVSATSFEHSPVPRCADLPPMKVVLVPSSLPPSGAGEAAMTAGSAAVANAIFNATGVRWTQFPLRAAALHARLSTP